MNNIDLIEVRNARPDDKSFIFSTYLRGLYYGNVELNRTNKDLFMKHYHALFEKVLSRSHINVACLKEDPDVILGYSVFSPDKTILHWVFCKSAWRNIGISKMLIPPTVQEVSHLTKVGLSIAYKKLGDTTFYNPFILTVGGK